MTAFIVAFTIVHGWLQAFGLYLESLFSLSPPPHPSLLFASPPPFFLLSQSPDCKSKDAATGTKPTRHASTEKKPQLPLPSCLTTSSACQPSSVFFGQFCDVAKMAMIHSKMIYPQLPTKQHHKKWNVVNILFYLIFLATNILEPCKEIKQFFLNFWGVKFWLLKNLEKHLILALFK